jgi:hypothetical protein
MDYGIRKRTFVSMLRLRDFVNAEATRMGRSDILEYRSREKPRLREGIGDVK